MSEALADISKAGTPEKWEEAINQRPFFFSKKLGGSSDRKPNILLGWPYY